MTQQKRREYLIDYLLKENMQYNNVTVPTDEQEQKRLLRGLMNVRAAQSIDENFLKIQDDYLQEEIKIKGIVSLSELSFNQDNICIWQGDITRLKADAIMNAANSALTGCYHPNHNCIDNCIHTFSGVQMRIECAEIMEKQGFEEPCGKAKITSGYNLPCKYVLHTVGPIIYDKVTQKDEKLLSSCYEACLKLALDYNINSIAFCCISTGVFRFPNRRAAEIAVSTVKKFKRDYNSQIKVIFNVFKDTDKQIYEELLG